MSVRGTSRIWNDQTIALLREMYPTTPAQDIADVIGCSDCSVTKKAHELGLKRDPTYHRNNFVYRFTHKGRYRNL